MSLLAATNFYASDTDESSDSDSVEISPEEVRKALAIVKALEKKEQERKTSNAKKKRPVKRAGNPQPEKVTPEKPKVKKLSFKPEDLKYSINGSDSDREGRLAEAIEKLKQELYVTRDDDQRKALYKLIEKKEECLKLGHY